MQIGAIHVVGRTLSQHSSEGDVGAEIEPIPKLHYNLSVLGSVTPIHLVVEEDDTQRTAVAIYEPRELVRTAVTESIQTAVAEEHQPS